MNRFKNYLYPLIGIIVLLASQAVIDPQMIWAQANRGSAPPMPVTVTNEVSVRDTVQPFHVFCNVDFANGSNGGGGFCRTIDGGTAVDFFVPAGKVAIIEYMSMNIELPPGQVLTHATIYSYYSALFPRELHYILVTPQPNLAIRDRFGASQVMQFHALAGDGIFADFSRDSVSGIGSGQVMVSGRLVNAQ